MEFEVLHASNMQPVNAEVLAEIYSDTLIECDVEGFAITEDGTLILSDECGHFVYIPREGRYVIRFEFAGSTKEIGY